MVKLLPPTVGKRLAKCGDRVLVYGIVPGTEVTLRVNSSEDTKTINANAHTFVLSTPLIENDIIRARQRLGSNESDWSPEVEVEDVSLPPTPPLTEPSIPRCGNSVRAWGIAPGSRIIIESHGSNIAEGIANRQGSACIGLNEPPLTSAQSSTITCGIKSLTPFDINVIGSPTSLPPPVILEPVFGCQNHVVFDELVPGTKVEIIVTDEHGDKQTYSFNTCWNKVNAGLGKQLAIGDHITARQSMARQEWDCNVKSDYASEVIAVKPDSRIKPIILEPVYEDSQIIRVTNQIEGGMITVFARASEHDPEEEVGYRSSSEFAEIPVPKLKVGQVLRVAQELCRIVEYSDPVTVKSRPTDINAPTVRKPLYACGSVVLVENVLPGAMVHIKQSVPNHTSPEYTIGLGYGKDSTLEVSVFPFLVESAFVRAYQVIGGQPSEMSPRVKVDKLEGILPPKVDIPVLVGNRSVWVTEIVPGAYVRIFDRGNQIGGSSVGTTEAYIPVWIPIKEDAIITARQMLCLNESSPSPPVPASSGPCDGPPQYDPDIWNDLGKIQCCNNCYNYACNIRTDNFAQPGRASSGNSLPYGLNCEGVSRAAVEDGLKRMTNTCSPCHHKVALVIAPGSDYHWYRQDQNAYWSHKPGVTPATNLDNSQNIITDLATANRGPYTKFCGYFCVYKPDISILGGRCPKERCDYWV